MSVKFDPTTFTESEKIDLDRFFSNHPEIQSGAAIFKLDKINPDSPELPPGTIATVQKDTKITPSLMPRQLAGIAVLYELEPFSDIKLLGNRPKAEQSVKKFFQSLGNGPSVETIGLAVSGHLPKDRGHDIKAWAPTLGTNGYVSVLTTKEIGEEPRQYLLVSVPHLPFALDTFNKMPIMTVDEMIKHEDYTTVRSVAGRNADKIASAFANAFELTLRHRKYDSYATTSVTVGKALASTFAETLVRSEHEITICANIGRVQDLPSKLTVQPISPKIGAVLTAGIVYDPIEMPYTTTNTPIKTAQEIGSVFLNDRVLRPSGLKTEPPLILKHDKHTQASVLSFTKQRTGTLLHPVLLVANE
jgi:hypothetical protein